MYAISADWDKEDRKEKGTAPAWVGLIYSATRFLPVATLFSNRVVASISSSAGNLNLRDIDTVPAGTTVTLYTTGIQNSNLFFTTRLHF